MEPELYEISLQAKEPDPWQPDGTGILPGGDVGGDIQQGEAWSARFRLPGKPGSMVTVMAYAARFDPETFIRPPYDGTAFVQVQAEFLTCTNPADPGGTETWSDVAYRDEPGTYASDQDADRAARQLAATFPAMARLVGWDGEEATPHAIRWSDRKQEEQEKGSA